MRTRYRTLVAALALATAPAFAAMDVAGVTFEDKARLGGTELTLNGAGVRTKVFFKVYAIGLYLPEKKSDTDYTVTGNLEMHGVTKSVSFPATVAQDGDTARISAKFDINRFDWNMVFKGKPDDLIRKEVVLTLNLEAKPAS